MYVVISRLTEARSKDAEEFSSNHPTEVCLPVKRFASRTRNSFLEINLPTETVCESPNVNSNSRFYFEYSELGQFVLTLLLRFQRFSKSNLGILLKYLGLGELLGTILREV